MANWETILTCSTLIENRVPSKMRTTEAWQATAIQSIHGRLRALFLSAHANALFPPDFASTLPTVLVFYRASGVGLITFEGIRIKNKTTVALFISLCLLSTSSSAGIIESFGSGANQFNMTFVPIGNPGNPSVESVNIGFVSQVSLRQISLDSTSSPSLRPLASGLQPDSGRFSFLANHRPSQPRGF